MGWKGPSKTIQSKPLPWARTFPLDQVPPSPLLKMGPSPNLTLKDGTSTTPLGNLFPHPHGKTALPYVHHHHLSIQRSSPLPEKKGRTSKTSPLRCSSRRTWGASTTKTTWLHGVCVPTLVTEEIGISPLPHRVVLSRRGARSWLRKRRRSCSSGNFSNISLGGDPRGTFLGWRLSSTRRKKKINKNKETFGDPKHRQHRERRG